MVVPEAARSGRVEDAADSGAWARVMGRLKEEVGRDGVPLLAALDAAGAH